EQYRLAIVEEQKETTNLLETLLILFFIIAIISTFIGFIFFLLPTRTILFAVAESSSKMTELDPEIDCNERTGMGAAGWKDQYSCDCQRIDKQHQIILLYLAQIVKKQIEIAGIVVRATFASLRDEEHLINEYKIANTHKKEHYIQHAAIIRKIQQAMLSLAQSRTKDAQTLIPSSHAQSLIRLYSSWLSDHVTKMDRELVTVLIGKAPESELEREVQTTSKLHVPHSYTQFLDSDNASLKDRSLFTKLIKILKLKDSRSEE
ncbi:MAG: hypothetical protein EZS28_025798, partial [Streblomastix strix]